MTSYSKRALLTNTFGMFGYLSCLISWLWITILYLPLIINNNQVREIVMPLGEKAWTPTRQMAPSPAFIFVGFAIALVIMAITVIVLLRAPITIAKAGKAVTTKAADSLEPLVMRGKKLPAKERRRLTADLIKVIKLLIVLAPVAAAFLTIFIPPSLPYAIIVFISGSVAAVAVFWFGVQYVCAGLLGVKPEELV